MRAVVAAADMITPYGRGIEACWRGLLSGRTAIRRVDRFSTRSFHSDVAGTVPGLAYHGTETLVMQMLKQLFTDRPAFPAGTTLLLATTKGEIDLLEQSMLSGRGDPSESRLERLLGKVMAMTAAARGMVVSAACTSSAAAVARAAALVRSGRADSVLVVGCDSVTEFIYSGFSSLMALDKVPSRPFDRDRAGLTVGEAAAWALIMSAERAGRDAGAQLGEVLGWGSSDDANHMTGPSRTSEGLILAVDKALASAGIGPSAVDFISAHGTGTVYNDAMEMRAFRKIFHERPLPVYSVKGGIGHTMGAAGLVEVLVALKALRERTVPPTVNLSEPDGDAAGWVAPWPVPVRQGARALVTNAGFSGVNTAVVLA